MRIGELLRARRDEILRIAAKHGARNVRLFGSAARGDAGPASDLDFLVEMEDLCRGDSVVKKDDRVG